MKDVQSTGKGRYSEQCEEHIVVVVPAHNEERRIAVTLDALCNQSRVPAAIIIVDNASTDGTARIVRDFQAHFPFLHLICEPEKGTGYACRTGFRHAISTLGATIVLRTDADSRPSSMWVETASVYFAAHPHKLVLSGMQMPLMDTDYRWHDTLVWPIFEWVDRIIMAIHSGKLFWLKLAAGANMGVRSSAYLAVGGFEGGHIGTADEDVRFNDALHALYGFQSFGYSAKFFGNFSMRRLRRSGYKGFLQYHSSDNEEERRRFSGGEIDIR